MKTILVPTDFSKVAKSAAMYAAGLAQMMKARVQLVSVIEVKDTSQTLHYWQRLRVQLEQNAESEAAKLISELETLAPGVRFSYKSLFGFPIVHEIIEFGRECQADIIVTGTKDGSGLKKAIMGTNTAALISASTIPVITVPARAVFKGYNRIMLASDMKLLDKELKQVVQFAKPFNSHIDILHVMGKEREVRSRNTLESLLARITGHKRLHMEFVKSDNINKALNDAVVEKECDLLIMFTHELDLFERVFGMGVTRQMSFHSNVPLLSFKKAGISRSLRKEKPRRSLRRQGMKTINGNDDGR